MKYIYHHLQNNGSRFTITSRLPPKEEYQYSLKRGAGLKTLWQLIDKKWVEINGK